MPGQVALPSSLECAASRARHSYWTRSRYSPQGGAVLPASLRGRPASSGSRSRPSSIEPTRILHMWRTKLTASIVKCSSSPSSSQAAARTVRSKSRWFVSVGVKAVKSCVPGNTRRGGVQGGAVQLHRPPERPALLERRADAAPQDAVAVGTRGRREARVEVRRGLVRRDHRDVGRQRRVQRLRRAGRRRAAGDANARDLSGRVHAGVGPSRDRELPPARVDAVERLAQNALDRALARLARPAAKPGAVVLQGQLQRLLSHGRAV